MASPTPGMKGYYVRPSRAIEKGGGFFVPGLEDEKIRIVSGVFLLLLYAINSIGVDLSAVGPTTYCGVFVTVLLLVQGLSALIPAGNAAPSIGIGGSGGSRGSGGIDVSGYLTNIQSSKNLAPTLMASLSSVTRTLVQTCDGVNYVLIVSGVSGSKENSDAAASPPEVILEFGSVKTKASTLRFKDSVGVVDGKPATKPNKIKLLTPEELRNEHGPLVASASFPEGTRSVALVEDGRGWTWFVASGAEVAALDKQALWIESLLYAPVS